MERRYVIGIGSPECPEYGIAPLDRVEEDVRRILDFFSVPAQGCSIQPHPHGMIRLPSEEIKSALCRWFAEEDRKRTDIVIVYIAGHGAYGEPFGHRLLTVNSDRRRADSFIPTADLVRWFYDGEGERPQSILLILDVCFAGKGGAEALAEMTKALKRLTDGKSAGLWVVATTAPTSEAGDGTFVDAFQDIVKDDAWFPSGGVEYLSPIDLVAAVNEWFEQKKKPQIALCEHVGGSTTPRFIRNPNFSPDLDGLSVEERAHWDPKARGVDGPDIQGWFFTGRMRALAELTDWLTAPNSDGRVRVVTGAPGSGKSAVLAWLVLASKDSTRKAMLEVSQATLPPVGAVAARVHAKGARLTGVVRSLCASLKSKAVDTEGLLLDLANRDEPFGIIIDSLDEAAEVTLIERELLVPLASCPKVRLIVGTRIGGNPARRLLQVAKIIDLDARPYFVPGEIADYAFTRLTWGGASSPYASSAHHDHARAIAERIAEKAGRSFLYARLVCRQLLLTDPFNLDGADWETCLELPANLTGAFGADLDRFDHEKRCTIIDLLVPLAYARGKGLPQKSIWHTVASKISGRSYSNSDIRDLKELAGYYLVQDTEFGDVVYRLFHQTFAEYLMTISRDADVEAKFADALYSLCHPVAPGGKWLSAGRYITEYLPSHAAAADILEKFLIDPNFLFNVAPEALLPELSQQSLTAAAHRTAIAYRQSIHWIRAGHPASAAYLAWAAMQCNAEGLLAGLRHISTEGSWSPEWAVAARQGGEFVVAVASDVLRVAAICRDSRQMPLVAAMDVRGVIRIWDAVTAQEVTTYNPVNPGAGERPQLCYTQCGPYHALVASWGENSLAVIDVETGNELGRHDVLEGTVIAMCIVPDGEHNATLAVAIDNGSICSFRLPSCDLLARQTNAVKATIYGMFPLIFTGVPAFASCGDTYSNGKLAEFHPKRIWSSRDLSILWTDSCKGDVYFSSYSFSIGSRNFFIFTSSNILHLHEQGTALHIEFSEEAAALDEICGHLPYEDGVMIIGTRHQKLTAIFFHATNGQPFLKVLPTNIDASKVIGPIIELHSSLSIIGTSGNQIRAYDVMPFILGDQGVGKEVREPFFNTEVPICELTADARHVTATDGRILWCWTSSGKPVWKTSFNRSPLSHLQIGVLDGTPVVIGGDNDGSITVFSIIDGSILRQFEAGLCVQALILHDSPDGLIIFVATSRKQHSWSRYFVRAWNLSTGGEILTWSGPQSLPPSDRIWQIEMDGYYSEKPLKAIATLKHGRDLLVSLAGPNGEVRTINLSTLKQVDVVTAGMQGYYVTALSAMRVGNEHVIFGGDQQGSVFRRDPCTGTSPCQVRHGMHHGGVTAMCTVSDPQGLRVVTGGEDGRIMIWTSRLELLTTVESNHPVKGLAHIGQRRIAVATECTVSILEID